MFSPLSEQRQNANLSGSKVLSESNLQIDVNSDLGRDMEKEKRKLNRFFEIRDQGEQNYLTKNERAKKLISDKERRAKKRQEAEKKELKARMKQYQALDEMRKAKLRMREFED